MTLYEFHEFLIEHSGITSKATRHYIESSSDWPMPAFFEPYQSPADFLIRASSVFTGPVVLSLLAVECLIASVASAFISLGQFIDGDSKDAKESIEYSGYCLLAMGCHLLAAAVSPIVNAIDLIGGGIASAQESEAPSYFGMASL